METDPVSKTLCSYLFRILDDAEIPWTSDSEENIWTKES
jgi:hypothetical protein